MRREVPLRPASNEISSADPQNHMRFAAHVDGVIGCTHLFMWEMDGKTPHITLSTCEANGMTSREINRVNV